MSKYKKTFDEGAVIMTGIVENEAVAETDCQTCIDTDNAATDGNSTENCLSAYADKCETAKILYVKNGRMFFYIGGYGYSYKIPEGTEAAAGKNVSITYHGTAGKKNFKIKRVTL